MNPTNICNRIIEYCFYALFFFIPLTFYADTSELFEFNKMWLTFVFAIVIAGAWGSKMIFEKKLSIQKTPLDIPLFLFLVSQIISTIFSLDTHTSIWGYYSRFNGGLLSIITYIFLYYAFVSTMLTDNKKGSSFLSFKKPLFSFGIVSKIIFWTSLLTFFLIEGVLFLDQYPSANQQLVCVGFGMFLTFFFGSLLNTTKVYKSIIITLLGGLMVVLWGIPSHFGYDPTCLLFRGSLDVSCWTDAFQPKIRMFSTLGQPNWLAAYLAILVPIALALFLQLLKLHTDSNKEEAINTSAQTSKLPTLFFSLFYFILAVLFFIGIVYTGSRSGFLGLLVGGLVFFLLSQKKVSFLQYALVPFLILCLFVGTPIDSQIKQVTSRFFPSNAQKTAVESQVPLAQGTALETGGTESGTIRLIVWRGAIDAWLHNPFFGTGVETFAFAYYKYRPAAHNLTSEWDYLYNKAHNEYLNYLTTTGIFGLGSYFLIIGTFLFLIVKKIWQTLFTHNEDSSEKPQDLLILGLLAGYISILVSNFLGFSVVIINIYFFLIPAFVFAIIGMVRPQKAYTLSLSSPSQQPESISIIQWGLVIILLLPVGYAISLLYHFWDADLSYARGYNLDRAAQYEYAYYDLVDAVQKRPDEPTFIDELAYNTGVLGATFLANVSKVDASESAQIASYAAKLTNDSLLLSDKNTTEHPNDVVFWKTKVRILNLLDQQDPSYIPLAVKAAEQTMQLAPTDAKVAYTLGILYGQNNEKQKAIDALTRTIQLKPDYRDAYYALALFYHDMATDKNSRVIHPELQEKAVETMQYILDHIATDDADAKKALQTWQK